MVMLKDKKISKPKTAADPPKTEGLTPLDVNRASSVADEGGTSAAATEHQRSPRQSVEQTGKDESSDDCGCVGVSGAETRQYVRPSAGAKL